MRIIIEYSPPPTTLGVHNKTIFVGIKKTALISNSHGIIAIHASLVGIGPSVFPKKYAITNVTNPPQKKN